VFKYIILYLLILNFNLLIASDNLNYLTKNEKEYITTHNIIKVHNEVNWPPYNFNKDGIPKGFSIDYINLLADELNIKIQYVTGYTWSEYMDMIQTKNLDLIINIAKNTVKKAVAVVTPTKSETENKELEEGIEDTPLEDNPILNENYSDYDAAQTKDFGVRLKKYAKKTGIKVHPATKDIVKILAKINEGLK
jgi:hypothetical protein